MWELIFLMLIMKIPIVYLCLVVWWAVRAEPRPPEPAIVNAELDPGIEPHAPWQAGRVRRPRKQGPHGSARRRPVRYRRAART
ncbi:MAG: hypothetical protein M3R70_12830 [Actinomycetota bacterium]|nr:hypothetical protein [Actinomycetota bacterium]